MPDVELDVPRDFTWRDVLAMIVAALSIVLMGAVLSMALCGVFVAAVGER